MRRTIRRPASVAGSGVGTRPRSRGRGTRLHGPDGMLRRRTGRPVRPAHAVTVAPDGAVQVTGDGYSPTVDGGTRPRSGTATAARRSWGRGTPGRPRRGLWPGFAHYADLRAVGSAYRANSHRPPPPTIGSRLLRPSRGAPRRLYADDEPDPLLLHGSEPTTGRLTRTPNSLLKRPRRDSNPRPSP